MKLTISLFTGIAIVAATIAIAGGDHTGGVKLLRQNSMFDMNVSPDSAKYTGDEPGENKVMPRGFNGAPPQIPHMVADFVVNLESNDCIDCHEIGQTDVVPVPASHIASGKLNMKRYQCSLCHVPQSDVKPLVKNENDIYIVAK